MKSIRQLHLPYCVILLESKRVAILNRGYRHLGQSSDGPRMSDEEYAAYLEKGSVKYKGLTRRALDKVCWRPMRKDAGDPGYIGWLYNDGTIPTRSKANWAAYTARLEKLAKFGD